MKRFILITFGALFWAYYAMSGGSDFEPGWWIDTEAQTASAAEDPVEEPVSRAETSGALTNVSLSAPAVVPASARAAPASTSAPDGGLSGAAPVRRDPASSVTGDTANAGVVAGGAATAGPSGDGVLHDTARSGSGDAASEELLTAQAGPTALPQPVQSTTASSASVDGSSATMQRDLRRVDGSVVNMRSGPGTEFAIVTQLGRGAPVEVLRDTGTGWLQLRALESGRTGWMADRLVTASGR